MKHLMPLALAMLALTAMPAGAETPPPVRAASTAPAADTQPAATGGFDAAARIDNAGLHAMTGRDDLNMVINARNTAQVSGNAVNGTSVTGAVDFSGGAFQNLNGLSVISANTGNNVAINSSLNVNVAVRP